MWLRLLQTILWPALWVYFRTFGRRRSRILIKVGDEILLIRDAIPLIGDKAAWSLAGGGISPGETALQAAKREVYEELGITIDQESIQLLGTERTTHRGIAYSASFFFLEMQSKPELTLQKHEVQAAQWFRKESLSSQKLNPAVKQALALLAQQ